MPFWDHWEVAVLDQILAWSLLEANFCNLRAFGPAIKIPFWDHWETTLLGQILAGSLLEANFGLDEKAQEAKKIQLFEGQIKAKRTVLEPGKTEKGLASSKRRF